MDGPDWGEFSSLTYFFVSVAAAASTFETWDMLSRGRRVWMWWRRMMSSKGYGRIDFCRVESSRHLFYSAGPEGWLPRLPIWRWWL